MTKKIRKEFTSGEIAKHCGVSFEAITKWKNKGRINFPWRFDQQVSFDEFIIFLNELNLKNKIDSSLSIPTVLVIDDDANIISSIGRVFHSMGINVLSADNGFKAGYIINQQKPQIITLDLNMESVDGYDVLKMIKGFHLENKVWVVVISGEPNDCLEKSIELGVDFILKKPFSKNDLEKIIRKLYPEKNTGEKHERSSFRRAV